MTTVEADTDEQAIQQATLAAEDGLGAELWQGARLVQRLAASCVAAGYGPPRPGSDTRRADGQSCASPKPVAGIDYFPARVLVARPFSLEGRARSPARL